MVAPRPAPDASPFAAARRCPYCQTALTMPAIAEGDDLLHVPCHTARRVERLERMVLRLAEHVAFPQSFLHQ